MQRRAPRPAGQAELAVQIHDASTGLALGIGRFKGLTESSRADHSPDVDRVLAVLQDSLARLRQLSGGLTGTEKPPARRRDLKDSLTQEAKRLGVRLELDLVGDPGWLPPNQSELVELMSREALRNVRRHSGSDTCRMAIDLSTCPFTALVRDWGAGLAARPRANSGIALLWRLAVQAGCELSVGSRPGLGTDLLLVGPMCVRELAKPTASARAATAARSEDAEKTAEDGEQTAQGGHFKASQSRLTR